MKLINEIQDLSQLQKGSVLTIGNFDGVHLGHRQILKTAKSKALEYNTYLTAMTFEPHPVALLHPQTAPRVLTPLELKTHLLALLGVDALSVLKTTPQLLSLAPEDFVDRFLVDTIKPAVLVEGPDFNFGYKRTGNIAQLRRLGPQKGFDVYIVKQKNLTLSTGGAVTVSSTIIRNLLEAGSVADAAVALARPYRLIGKVIPGQGNAKQLGFPTANLQPTGQIIPGQGVYAGFVAIADSTRKLLDAKEKAPAVFSIGTAPTFSQDRPQFIEAHLLVENVPDLLAKSLTMDFVKKLRDQIKFDSEKKLAQQIEKDSNKAKLILSNTNAGIGKH